MERIPSEIWSEVFGLARPEEPADFYQTSETPWSLSQVCRKWREAAHNSPVLWSTIVLHQKTIEVNEVYRNLPSYKFRLTKFLEYSRNFPLEIRLWTWKERCMNQTSTVITVTRALLQMLWPHRSRWAELTSNCDYKEWSIWTLYFDFAPEKQGMSALRRLSLPRLLDGGLGCSTFLSLFSHLPSLSSLHIHEFPYLELQPSTINKIQWSSLRNLSLYILASSTPLLSPLLEHLHDVTILHINVIGTPRGRVNSAERQILPNLEGLCLGNAMVNWFFSQFTAPRVQALDLSYFRTSPSHMLSSVLAQSHGTLRYLFIHKQSTVNGFEDLLCETSALELLSLDRVNEDVFLTTLTSLATPTLGSLTDDEPADSTMETCNVFFPCPRLRSLCLQMDTSRTAAASQPQSCLDAFKRFFDVRVLPLLKHSSSNLVPSCPGTTYYRPCLRINTGYSVDLRDVAGGEEYLEHVQELVGAGDRLDVDVGCYHQYSDPLVVSSLHPNGQWTRFEPDLPADCAAARLGEFVEGVYSCN